MWYAVDRFEGEWAVLQDDEGQSHNVERSRLPQDIRQGDVLRQTDQGICPGSRRDRPPAGAGEAFGGKAEAKAIALGEID